MQHVYSASDLQSPHECRSKRYGHNHCHCHHARHRHTFKERMKQMKHRPIPPVARRVTRQGFTAIFWLVGLSAVYVATVYVIPYNYSTRAGWSDSWRAGLMAFAVFMFLQAALNWFCMRWFARKDAYGRTARKASDISNKQDLSNPEIGQADGYHHKQHLQDPEIDQGDGYHNKQHLQDPEIGQGDGHHIVKYNNPSCRRSLQDQWAATDEDPIEQYLSWKYCKQCQVKVPPRSRHCRQCNFCVLRRDHHCFLNDLCIGHYNESCFVVLLFYTMVASIWGPVELYFYLRDNYWQNARHYDYVLPVTIYRWISGAIPLHIFLMIIQLYACLRFGVHSFSLFVHHMICAFKGLTSYEVIKNKKCQVRSIATIAENLRVVFGKYGLINFIVPGQFLLRREWDGTWWPHLKSAHPKQRAEPILFFLRHVSKLHDI